MKKLTTSILLALFSATIFTPTHVEASWLSKTWEKIEKSWNESGMHNTATETSSPTERVMYLPQRSEYPSNFGLNQVVGHSLDSIEYQVLGVPMGATFGQVKASLGQPTSPGHGLVYGGVRFTQAFTKGDSEDSYVVDYIEITNRDAVTHRGIGVGDSLESVYQAYGRPNYINSKNDWFYGYFVWSSDAIRGIYFENDGERVTKIKVVTS